MPSSRDVAAQTVDALQVSGLKKHYGEQTVLADIAFALQSGEVVGIIGPNGAGKTTLLEAIAGLLPVDAGEVSWNGRPLQLSARREVLFYLPDGVRPYHDQPVFRVLTFLAEVYGRSPEHVRGVVASMALAPVLQKRVHALSKGYNRRLLLALGLLVPHPLLLMDEPFDGFDLRQVREVVQVLRQVAAEGRTLVLAIHQMSDAEKICDRFILLADGRIRGAGTLSELRAQTARPTGKLEDIFLALT